MSRGRRNVRRGQSAGGATLASQFADLFLTSGGGDSRFESQSYTDNGTKVTAFRCMVDATHLLAQATDANRVLIPTADAAMGSALTSTFVSASSTNYVSNRAPSDWQYAHDGSGCTVVAVYTPLGAVTAGAFGTRGAVPPENGMGLILVPSTSNSIWQNRQNGFNGSDATVAAGGTPDVPTYEMYDHLQSRTPNVRAYLKSTLTASEACITPAAVAPDGPMTLGSYVGAALPVDMKWRALYCWRRVLTAAEQAIVQTYIQATTGIVP